MAYGKDGNGNGLWVAVGSGSVIAKSSDGSDWRAADSSGGLTSGQYVAYNGIDRWVAVGNGGSFIVTSTNGTNWTAAASIPPINFGYCVTYGNGFWIAFCGYGYTTRTLKSTDGSNWSQIHTQSGNSFYATGVAYNNATFIAIGNSGGTSGVSKSTDGGNTWSDWVVFNTASNINGGINGIGYNNGLWVISGSTSNGFPIATSSDGNTWNSVTVANKGGLTVGYGIAYGNGTWIVGGGSSGSKFIKSTSGTSWSAVTSVGGITQGQSVAFKTVFA